MRIHNIITILLVISFSVSCTPMATVVPTTTPMPTSTFTPFPPTPTITPTLTPIPTATPLPYMGCGDQKLIAEQDSEFAERTGIVLNNPDPTDAKSQKFAEAVSRLTSVGWNPDRSEIKGFPLYKTGTKRVAVRGIPGISEVVCLYARNGIFPNETFSFLVGWIDNNETYHQFTFAWEAEKIIPGERSKWYEEEEQLAWVESLPDGTYMYVNVHTFSGVPNLSDIRGSDDDWNTGAVESVKLFLSKLKSSGNDILARMQNSSGNVVETWKSQQPELLDMGFIPAGQWYVLHDFSYNFEE